MSERFRSVLLRCYEVFAVVRAEAMRKSGLYRGYNGAENVFLAEMSLKGRFVELPAVLFYSRWHDQRFSANRTGAGQNQLVDPRTSTKFDELTKENAMKVGILAGGVGSRISEETEVKPKPMVEIGGKPILWHILKHYEFHGFTEFAIALGYKGDYIKKYMVDYVSLNGNVSIDFSKQEVLHDNGNGHTRAESWKVELVETGLYTATGGRIKRLAPYLGNGTFMLTWGDGVSNVDLRRVARLSPIARQTCHGYRRASAGPLRQADVARPTGRPLQRKAAAGRRLDQRCLLRARTRGLRLRRW